MTERIAWVTNLAAPYRIPVWNHIGHHADLDVLLLDHGKDLETERFNRGAEWRPTDMPRSSYRTQQLRSSSISVGERRFYLWARGLLGHLRGADTVVLGGWESPVYWIASYLAARIGARRVGFYESHLLSQRHRGGAIERARRRYFRALDAVVVPGVAAQEALIAMGVDRTRIVTGFNAVDSRAINAAAEQVRTESTRSGDDLRGTVKVAYVGQLIERKNVDGLLRAFATLTRPELKMTVVGVGPLLEHLQSLATELGRERDVTFAGHVPYADLPHLLAEHHVLVLPSHEEVWGLVVNEALAAGLRVVVSDRCGVAPSVATMDGVTITSTRDDELAAALAGAVESGPQWIANPAILEHGPEEFAQKFLIASGIEYATQRSIEA